VITLIAAAMADLMPRGADLPGCADCDPRGFLRRLRRESHPLFFTGLVLGGPIRFGLGSWPCVDWLSAVSRS